MVLAGPGLTRASGAGPVSRRRGWALPVAAAACALSVAGYAADHGLPEHPLVAQGYLSIGCAPTTRPVGEGEDPRAGRWLDSDKVECGLHI